MCHDPFDPQHWRWCTTNNSTKLGIHDVVVVCVYVCVLFRFNVLFNNHIATVSGCDRELNAHFYNAASPWYQLPDTLLDTTPSHIILTVLALNPKIRVPSGEHLVTLSTTLVCHGPGWNPVPSDLGADTLHTALQRTVRGCSARHLQHELVWT